ncbi:hypothetical protein F3Y22_tig00111772pilonHSYRG00311 [Hibiscus syriacus]|uniref:Uncharacterized protein n=1 Tax=Hibiscus syriacus TaxID=106335 RepID=A0A6A2XDT8_HIBSY|nr:hypothetical protein F3Y22_tig00111772pilonHSYRG00311 [Hibiscus syriacus]
MKNLSIFERALIDAGGGGIAGASTYVCLLPLDTIKTKMQTKGASKIMPTPSMLLSNLSRRVVF